MKKLYIFFIFCIVSLSINAQNNVGIGTNTPDPSAKLEINTGSDAAGSKKGLLIPKVDLANLLDGTAFTGVGGPATGLIIYNTTSTLSSANDTGFYVNAGTKALPIWLKLITTNDDKIAWNVLGNYSNPVAAPSTYGTSPINTAGGENFLGTILGTDFVIGTNKIERTRFTSDGRIGIGTATPNANTLATFSPYNNTFRHGILFSYPGSGTISSTAYALDIDVSTNANQNVRGLRYVNSTTGAGAFYGSGAELLNGSSATVGAVSGYLGYKNGSSNSFGVYGIAGTNSFYTAASRNQVNAWAGFFKGRVLIAGDDPTPGSATALSSNSDLDVRNSIPGAGNPATVSLRQSTSNTTSGTVMDSLNFGDNTSAGAQAAIIVSRDASGGTSDMPTRMTFSTTPDGSSTLTERMRIDNIGNVGIGTTPSDKLDVLPTAGKDVLIGGGATTGSELKLTYSGINHFSIYNKGDNKLTIANTSSTFNTNTTGTTIMTLDNSNNVAIPNGYLKVGNTSTPNVQNATYNVYSHSFTAGDGGWLRSNPTSCGNTQQWVYQSDGGNTWSTCGLRWDNETGQNADGILSPWIWIPTNSGGNITFGMETYLDLETSYDGCYIQYTTNGSSWTKVLASDFVVGPYENTGTPSGTQCSSTGVGTNGFFTGYIYQKYRRFSLSLSGTWVRFRFTAFCDNSNTSGYGMYLYGFSANVTNTTPATTTAYAPGNIYAQNNVYAGNNVLRGDVAEYFPVDTKSEPGTLIAIKDGFADQYTISKKFGDDRVIGIQSTNPTLLINNPKSGIPVALTGRVPVKVNNEGGKIKIGDYLIASSTPGVATKTDKAAYVIGRALENFDSKTGTILCLVQNGFYNPGKSFDMERSLGSFTSNERSNKIIVYDNSITPKSKIFMTYRNKVGSENWVSKIEQGYFEVQFDKTLDHSVQFDYLVENANLNKSNDFSSNSSVTIIDNSKFDEITANIKSDEIKKTELYVEDQVMKEIMSNGNIKTYTLPVETSTALPPAPLDVTKGAAWTASKGLFIAASKVRTEEEFYDYFKKIKAKINKY